MKKILALALAIVLAFAIAIPAFATDVYQVTEVPVDGTYPEQSGDSVVEYNVYGNYIVTVPATISLAATTVDGEASSAPCLVDATKVLIPYECELQIFMKTSGELVFNPNGGEAEDIVNFKIYDATDSAVSTTAIEDAITAPNGFEILTVNEDGVNTLGNGEGSSSDKAYFGIRTITMPKYNDRYEGTITFTINVVDVVNP